MSEFSLDKKALESRIEGLETVIRMQIEMQEKQFGQNGRQQMKINEKSSKEDQEIRNATPPKESVTFSGSKLQRAGEF